MISAYWEPLIFTIQEGHVGEWTQVNRHSARQPR
jgi:hypothetical protein